MDNKKMIALQLDDKLYTRLNDYVEKEDKTISKVVRRAIEDYLDRVDNDNEEVVS